jgi:hypothetical protein
VVGLIPSRSAAPPSPDTLPPLARSAARAFSRCRRDSSCSVKSPSSAGSRGEIVKHPHFYTIRNYLVDFLVNRSGELRTADLDRRGLHYPRPVNPVAASATESDSADAPASASPTEKLVKFTPKETHHG